MKPSQPSPDDTGLRNVRSDMKNNAQSFFTLRNRIERTVFILVWACWWVGHHPGSIAGAVQSCEHSAPRSAPGCGSMDRRLSGCRATSQ